MHKQPSELGDSIRTQREALGWSSAELARKSAIDRTVLTRIESGFIRQPDPSKLARLARALDLPLTRLYTLAGYPAGRQLPSFQPYLRDRYRDLPPGAIEELTGYFDEILERYGASEGPEPGEDEQPI